MPTVTNKTRQPLRVPLPGGKILRLGPGKTGKITPKAVDHPPLKQLVDDEKIEIQGQDGPRAELDGGSRIKPTSPGSGPGPGREIRNTGDR